MSEPFNMIVLATAKEGCEEELGRRLSALVAPTRREAGCITYALHRSIDQPAVWMLHESWRSQADLDAHFQMPYLVEFFAIKDSLLAQDMDIRKYTAAPSGMDSRVSEAA
ncbi:putative quinol monooxygenase [Dyella subtropica]|uniref:putative quinol monooxygenase n=1 Tax=Dyella subtropica TaxID=2992127 RepID=UPI002257CBD5|nr:putative quinol monooxygenase [Dyella subtropica]